jgi:hypothetical protein
VGQQTPTFFYTPYILIFERQLTLNPKPVKKTKVNDNKHTVRLAWSFIEKANHEWNKMFTTARHNNSRVRLPKETDTKGIPWDEPINKEDPNTWVFVTLTTMGEVVPGWASESFDRTRFDGEDFWLVRWDNGELIKPEKGAAFHLEDDGFTVTVNEQWRDEFLLASSVFPQPLTTDKDINTHNLMGTLRNDGFPNTVHSLINSLFGIGETDPWFPVKEAIRNLRSNPSLESILAAEDAINKAIDETVLFEA